MLERIAASITERQFREGRITRIEQQIYQYGYILMMEVGINILISVIIGIVCHRLPAVIVLLAMLVPLRSYAGGVHMKKTWHCIIATNMVVLAVILIEGVVTQYVPVVSLVVTDIISGAIICGLSPIDTEAKPLDADERKLFKKKAVVICVLEVIINIVLLMLKIKWVAVIGVLSHIVIVIMLCLAKLQGYGE